MTVCPALRAQTVWNADNGDGTYTNPILWGDWPDPDVIRVGNEFYMVSTSMHYVPGCPILRSRDLVNWQMAGYAVSRYTEDPRYNLIGGVLHMGLGLDWTANRFALFHFSTTDGGVGGTADFNWFHLTGH